MQIGIMARTFVRPTLEETLDAVVNHGIHCIQFSFTCAGLPEMPDHIDAETCSKIRREMEARKIKMAAVSGTYNMIHPSVRKRMEGLFASRLARRSSPCAPARAILKACGGGIPKTIHRRPGMTWWPPWAKP